MIRKLFILTTIFLLALAAPAKEAPDSFIINLSREYYRLYDTDSAEAFYKVSEEIYQYFRQKDDIQTYYQMKQNEISYDSEHGEAYKAIQKANKMLEEMKESDVKRYDYVYLSLGNIFKQRGSYRMAMHYFEEAVANTDFKDSLWTSHLYSQLAAVNVTRDVEKAWYWNERAASVISPQTIHYKVYLVNKCQIYFFKGEKEQFLKTKQELDNLANTVKNISAYPYGNQIVKVMEAAMLGKYDEALQLLAQKSQDYDDIKRCDIRIQIYEMMGCNDWALREVDKRRDLRDSLNNDLLFNNINEINTSAGIAKLHEKAAKEREMWMGTVIVLLMIALGLIISRYLIHKRYQARIERQNEQLEVALDEAKESERMKNIFIQHISHEIRTPLNVITGYAQVITNPAFELENEERNKMLQAIGQNTVAITDIVNDLLEISQEESKERYRRDDRIVLNSFCRHIMDEEEEKNKGRLELKFKTSQSDNYTILSNKVGIERIIRQVLNNAMKFTEKGYVELSVYESADGGSINFAVTDTGVGIPEEEHEHVFENFYKVDSFKQGLGIGLSMCRKIAILLGGTLTIDKAYRQGTRMILTIPLK